jgi:hypothetical protein
LQHGSPAQEWGKMNKHIDTGSLIVALAALLEQNIEQRRHGK